MTSSNIQTLSLSGALSDSGSILTDTIQNPYMQKIWETVTLEFMFKFFVIYFFVIWVALILWVARDISYRTNSMFLQALCVLVIIFLSPLGIFLYLLIRPGKTIFEQYYEEVENNLNILNEIVQERLELPTHLSCPKCEHIVEADFLLCPNCHIVLKHQCTSCKKDIRETWEVCPYCKTLQTAKKVPKKKEKTSN